MICAPAQVDKGRAAAYLKKPPQSVINEAAMSDPFGDKVDPLVKSMRNSAVVASVDRAVAAERERCAKIAEGFANYGGGIANSIAAAIRQQ